jgi:predicted RNase H-like nuclease (RuvC/YqgF family)
MYKKIDSIEIKQPNNIKLFFAHPLRASINHSAKRFNNHERTQNPLSINRLLIDI